MELKTYFAQDAAGNIISSAIVNVFLQGTTTLATGLTRADGTPLENPFAADGAGRIQFRAPDGYYDVQVSAGPGIIQTLTIQCVDYSEAKSAAEQAQDALNSITGINNNFEQNSREQWRRSLAEAGLTLVSGSFEEGATVNSKTDAVWHISGGQCYAWAGELPKDIPARSNPAGDANWKPQTDHNLRDDLAGHDGAQYVGACSSVAQLRTVVPTTNGQRIALSGYYVGHEYNTPVMYTWNSASTATDDGGRVIAATGITTGRWILQQSGNVFDARVFGIRPEAAYSGSMTDSAAMFAKAQASVGTNGVIHFPLPDGWTSAHYLINAAYSYNWAQSWISSDPGVVIHNGATNDDEGKKPRLKSDVVFNQTTPTSSTDYTTKRGSNDYDLKSAIATAIATAVNGIGAKTLPMSFTQTARAIQYSSLDVNSSGINYTYTGTGMTIQADQIFWTDATAAGTSWQGVSFALKTGAEFEVLLENTGSASTGTIFVGAKMLGHAGAFSTTLGMRMTITTTSADTDSTNITFTNGNTVNRTITVYHPAEIIKAGGTNGVRAGVRMLDSRKIGLTLNGKLIHTMSTISTFVREGIIVMDQAARAGMRIKYGHHKVRKLNPYAMPKTLTCVGDSITRGARSSNEWPRLLEAYGEHMPGVGRIRSVTNTSVSGWRLRDFVVNIANYDFTGSDYVLIQLGTNDCQSNVGLTQYYNDVVTLGNKVLADGAFPIFGVFPKYTSSTITAGGNAPVNMLRIAQYQAVLRWACDGNGFALAFPDDFFGENYGYLGAFNNTDRFSDMWMNDNIHPNTRGQIAIAAAFMSALSRELTSPSVAAISHLANLTSGVTAYAETAYGLPTFTRIDDTVYLTGAIVGGAAWESVMGIPEFALPPQQVAATCFSRDAGELGVCQVYARPDGKLIVGEQYKSATAGWTELNISYKV